MKKILSFLLLSGALVSCKKENAPTPPPTCAVTEATIPGTYKITAIKYKASATSTETDQMNNLADCQKDDTYTFATDGSIILNDIGISCGLPPMPGDAWSLPNGGTNLRLGDEVFTVESFDCSKLVISKADVLVAGDKETRTYVKQ